MITYIFRVSRNSKIGQPTKILFERILELADSVTVPYDSVLRSLYLLYSNMTDIDVSVTFHPSK